MSWTWIEQRPHANGPKDQKPLHILVGTNLTTGEQTYLAFITEIQDDYNATLYRAMVPRVDANEPRNQKMTKPADWYYTHDSLQDAKDYCVAELVNRRLV